MAPAGCLSTTQYPAEYVNQVPRMDMMFLRTTNPMANRTYTWYTGTPVSEFGFGLHCTTCSFAWAHTNASAAAPDYSTNELIGNGDRSAAFLNLVPLDMFAVRVTNSYGE